MLQNRGQIEIIPALDLSDRTFFREGTSLTPLDWGVKRFRITLGFLLLFLSPLLSEVSKVEVDKTGVAGGPDFSGGSAPEVPGLPALTEGTDLGLMGGADPGGSADPDME